MKWLACVTLLVSSGCVGSVPQGSGAPPPTGKATLAPPSLGPSPSLPPMTAPFGINDLLNVVVTEQSLAEGMTVDDQLVGRDALVQPVALLEASTFSQQAGFVDARMTRVGTSGPGSYWEEGGFVAWAALYQDPAAAARAFEVLLHEHESDSGWGLSRVGRPPYGDEGASLMGPAYGFDSRLHIWRVANMVLAAVALGITATGADADQGLLSIADGMDARLRGIRGD